MTPFSTSSENSASGIAGAAAPAAALGWLRRTLRSTAGIHLTPRGASVAAARLARRMRATGSGSLGDYIALVESDSSGDELWRMIEDLVVNQTSFMREPDSFPYYLACTRELLRHHEQVTVWSAGCSTGEEVFTLAMLTDALFHGEADRVRFLATDISRAALRVGRAAVYSATRCAELPPLLQPLLESGAEAGGFRRIAPHIRRRVSFARHNLVGQWRMRGPMHVIFCRNVLIYFDRPTRRRVVAAFADILAPGGYLFLGATESLTDTPSLTYVQPCVYRKLPVQP